MPGRFFGKLTAKPLSPDAMRRLSEATVMKASRDPRRGLARIEDLLRQCQGRPDLISSAASLSYNRAAALRVLGQTEDAFDAYAALATEFGAHQEADVRFWVGLALYNHANLLMTLDDPERAVAELPALASSMWRWFADTDDPGLRRRLREVMRWELAAYQAAGMTAETARARELLHEVLRPDCAAVLALLARADPEVAADAWTPQWPGSREELVLSVLEQLDELLDVVREAAEAELAALPELILSAPELLTLAGVKSVTAVKDGAVPGAIDMADRERLARGLEMVSVVFRVLEGDPTGYSYGHGPVDELISATGFSISYEDALEIARSPAWKRALSLPAIVSLALVSGQQLDQGQWREALRMQQLLLAGAERLPNTDEGQGIAGMARMQWLPVARHAYIRVPDPRLFQSALDAAERLLRDPDALEPAQRAEVLLQLGALYIEPWERGPETAYGPMVRRWQDRLSEEDLGPIAVPDGPLADPPGPLDSIALGEVHLKQALPLARPAQATQILSLLMQARQIRRVLGQESDDAEYVDLMRSVIANLDPEDAPDQLALALASLPETDRQAVHADVEDLLSRPFARVVERSGSDAGIRYLGSLGPLLAVIDPARGRRLFAEAAGFVTGLRERERFAMLSVHANLLWSHQELQEGDLEVTDLTTRQAPQDARAMLLRRATEKGWSPERTALTLLLLGGGGLAEETDPERELSWVGLIAELAERFPAALDGHLDALRYLVAGLYSQVASRAQGRGDWDRCLRAYVACCDGYLALEGADAVMETLTLIDQMLHSAQGTSLVKTAELLGEVVIRAENLVGPPASEVLQRIWVRIISEVTEADGSAALFGCLQLAKGARFAASVRARSSFDAQRDASARRMLAVIESAAPSAERTVDFDEATLVTPYSGRLEAAAELGPAAVGRMNAEISFDTFVQASLAASAQAQLVDVDAVADQLPQDTVLLVTYPAGERTLSLACTRDRITLVPHRFPPGGEVNVALLREAVLAEPGPGQAVSRQAKALLDDLLAARFGPLAELLRQEQQAGRRHLLVNAHGPLHFAPLHLLHLDGLPLAETWAVTYLPSLALLDRPPPPQTRTSGVAAIGLGFPDGPYSAIPEAVAEAEAIAEAFGTEALTDSQATVRAVTEALTSAEFVHIATHGTHNVTAPAFQSLQVTDGRICAHDLLALDLSGVRLVTLSACETALGRYDITDNLRGIPASLLQRSARTIIGTLWPVETYTSHDFFTALYRELRHGRSILEAFTTAQRQTRERHPQYRDWGAFNFIGDSH